VARFAGALVNDADPLRAVRDGRRHTESHQGRPITTRWVRGRPDADRHRDNEVADNHPMLFVVSPQAPSDGGNERII